MATTVRHVTHTQAGAALISSLIQPRLKDHPNYRPNEITKDARRDAFVNVDCMARKRKSNEQYHGSYEDAYAQLPKLCLDLMKVNPGSTIILNHSTDNYF